jgi:hypothetical protein
MSKYATFRIQYQNEHGKDYHIVVVFLLESLLYVFEQKQG